MHLDGEDRDFTTRNAVVGVHKQNRSKLMVTKWALRRFSSVLARSHVQRNCQSGAQHKYSCTPPKKYVPLPFVRLVMSQGKATRSRFSASKFQNM